MKKYRVVWTVTEYIEDSIDAESVDEAKEKWEAMGLDTELFFIEDDEGNQVIFD